MQTPTSHLTPLQKASICVANADDSNISDMLVACQFIMGCYSTKQEQSPRLKEKLAAKFTASKQLEIQPAQKITFGNKKGLDITTLQRLLPTHTKTKRFTFNPSTYNKPVPKPQALPHTTLPPTNPYNTSNQNFNTTKTSNLNTSNSSTNVNSGSIRANLNSAPKTVTQDANPTFNKTIPKRKFEEDDEEEEEEKKEAFTTAKEKYVCTRKVKILCYSRPPRYKIVTLKA